jgi:hypothetical protein
MTEAGAPFNPCVGHINNICIGSAGVAPPPELKVGDVWSLVGYEQKKNAVAQISLITKTKLGQNVVEYRIFWRYSEEEVYAPLNADKSCTACYFRKMIFEKIK